MLYYWILLLIIIGTVGASKKKFKNSYILVIISLLLTGLLRTETVGTDVQSYCLMFNSVSTTSKIDTSNNIEPGFLTLIKFFKTYISTDAMLFVRSMFLIYFLMVTKSIVKFSDNKSLSYFAYYTLAFYFFSFNGIRQALALSIILLIITFTCKRDIRVKKALLTSILIVLVSFLFHRSLIITSIIPFIFIYEKSKLFSNKNLIIALIVSTFVSIFVSNSLLKIFSFIDISFLGNEKYISYVDRLNINNDFSFISNILHALFAIFLLYTTKNQNIWLQLYSFGTIILVLFSPMSWLFIRVADNYNFFIIFAIPFAWNEWKNNPNRTMYRIGVFIYCLVLFANRLQDDNFQDVVPYKSILFN